MRVLVPVENCVIWREGVDKGLGGLYTPSKCSPRTQVHIGSCEELRGLLAYFGLDLNLLRYLAGAGHKIADI